MQRERMVIPSSLTHENIKKLMLKALAHPDKRCLLDMAELFVTIPFDGLEYDFEFKFRNTKRDFLRNGFHCEMWIVSVKSCTSLNCTFVADHELPCDQSVMPSVILNLDGDDIRRLSIVEWANGKIQPVKESMVETIDELMMLALLTMG